MADVLHRVGSFMSSSNRRDPSRALRTTPDVSLLDEVTRVDPRAPRAHGAEPRRGAIPSIVNSARSPDVIPFTKPRAIAAIAASDPGAVVTMAPASPGSLASPAAPTMVPFQTPIRKARTIDTPGNSGLQRSSAERGARRAQRASSPSPVAGAAAYPTLVGAPSPRSAPAIPSSSPPSIPVSTGWTPPHAVNSLAQPVSPHAPSIAVTAWPGANAPAPAHVQASAQPAQLAAVHASHAAHAAHAAPAAPQLTPAPIVVTRPASQMPIAEPIAEPPPPRWGEYEALGLGPPKARPRSAARLIVDAYKLLGFAILTIIVIVLVGYIASTAFYYVSDSWIVPMAVSPTDEKVVALQAQLAEQENARDRIAGELQQAERAIAAQQAFQAAFARAIRSDLEGRKLALERIRELATAAARIRAAIKSQNAAYASASRRRMAQEYAAGLIDRTAMLSGKYQLAQITSSNLSLAERQAEYETRAAELEAQTRSLDAILANATQGSDGPALSYEVLRIKQEYEASRLDLARSVEARDTLKAALARQDRIVAALAQSAYLRAVRDRASVAFVPYGNLSNVEKGTPLYACKLGMLFCYHAGEVLEVLPGEVQFKHPHRDRNLRGQVVVLKLDDDDADAAADDVLFAGGRPILF